MKYKHLLFKDNRATRDYMRDKRAGTLNGRRWKDYASKNAQTNTFNERGLLYKDGQLSFKDKQSVLDWSKNQGTKEWTIYEPPKGHIYIIPDGALKYADLIGRLKEAGVTYSQMWGYTQRNIGGTGHMLGPIDITLKARKKKK